MLAGNFKGIRYPGWEIIRKNRSGSFGRGNEIEREKNGRCESIALKVITTIHDKGENERSGMKKLTDCWIDAHNAEHKDHVINQYETTKTSVALREFCQLSNVLPEERAYNGSRKHEKVSAFNESRKWEAKLPKPKKWPIILAGLALIQVFSVWGYFNIHPGRQPSSSSTKGEAAYTTLALRNSAFSIQTKTVADIALSENI